jgi:malate dehydrogenase
LIKDSELVSTLSLYDVAPITPGVAADLSHIPTRAKVEGYEGKDLGKALEGCDVVVIPAGVPRKPGMTRDDLFNTNASIVANIMKQGAETCPEACFLIISNPVNSTVPIASEILKDAGVYNPKKLFGVTTLDICRANTFVAENQGADVYKTNVNVVGGHAGITILPLLSQVEGATYTQEAKEALTQRIMFGGDEVVKAKAGGGSATLSMAYAGARFAVSTLRALNGEQGVVECAFVESDVASTKFFSSPVELGKDGVEKIHGIGDLDDFEKQKYDEMIPDLEKQIEKGLAFARTYGK